MIAARGIAGARSIVQRKAVSSKSWSKPNHCQCARNIHALARKLKMSVRRSVVPYEEREEIRDSAPLIECQVRAPERDEMPAVRCI